MWKSDDKPLSLLTYKKKHLENYEKFDNMLSLLTYIKNIQENMKKLWQDAVVTNIHKTMLVITLSYFCFLTCSYKRRLVITFHIVLLTCKKLVSHNFIVLVFHPVLVLIKSQTSKSIVYTTNLNHFIPMNFPSHTFCWT